MASKRLFHFLIVLIIACPVLGQVKKQLTEDDYHLWSTMESRGLSKNGNWVSYTLQYEDGIDTLFVKNTTNLKTIAFPGITMGQFATDNYFVARLPNKDVSLTNLKTGTQRTLSNIERFELALDGSKLVLLQSNGGEAGDLLVVALDGKILLTVSKVSLYSLNSAGTKLICDSDSIIQLIDVKKNLIIRELDSVKRRYTNFVWQKNGSSVAWLAKDNLETVGLYRFSGKKSFVFSCKKLANFSSTDEVSESNENFLISDDGMRVFFGVNEKKSDVSHSNVQIWNAEDKILFPARAASLDYDVPNIAVWFPEQRRARMITDSQFPKAILVPGQRYALLYNPLENEPQFDRDAPVNYYLQDITTGKQHLLLSNHSADAEKIGFSNTGRFIVYFKMDQWWSYDIRLNTSKDLTSHTGSRFTDENYDRSGEKKVSGVAGWTPNDQEIIVYDNFDLWLMNSSSRSAKRLTRGREQSIIYRVVSKSPYGATGSIANGILDLHKGIMIKANGTQKNGYFKYSDKDSLQQIVFESNRIGWLQYSDNGFYSYVREHFHKSPQLVLQKTYDKPMTLYESNPQQNNYAWGFSKLISYENSDGQLLNGALFYPADYDPDKNYPMVVYIYERLSDLYNQYVNPTLLNTDGFNICNLTTQGYFVLMPDIAFKEGSTGISALQCVENAVNEVLVNEPVNPHQIGIFGHSFGGYETNFIITQTSRFAAAITGAGISDVVSSYLSVGAANLQSDIWRYEYNQFRIGTSLFNDFQKYIQNSPITFASQIRTPVLIWCGKKDSSINYSQSLEFHMALRRLGKPNIFLLYENGGHAIMQPDSQKDLTHRTQQWFDYFLKGYSKPNWMSPN